MYERDQETENLETADPVEKGYAAWQCHYPGCETAGGYYCDKCHLKYCHEHIYKNKYGYEFLCVMCELGIY